MRISDWSSDVCSSDLPARVFDWDFNDRVRQKSLEARLAGDLGPIDWVVGVYAINDKVNFMTDLDYTDVAATRVRTNYTQTRKRRPVFGQVAWPITDTFTVPARSDKSRAWKECVSKV